jgi:PAS domain S-box-containing protein
MNPPKLDAEAWLAAIVENSEDAIVSKDLDGYIMSWNPGAERMFGYTAAEAIGQHITLLIPRERRDEENEILRNIRAGVRVEHLETVRRRKDGSHIFISLTVSPIKDAVGNVIGASKSARDIGDRVRAREQQVLLLQEMNHRIKNLFTLAGTVVSLSAPYAATSRELASDVQSRLAALAAAHQLTLAETASTPSNAPASTSTFTDLLRTIVEPYQFAGKERVMIAGPEVAISTQVFTSLALLLHEITSNSAKYGALSAPEGTIDIELNAIEGYLIMIWSEMGGPAINSAPDVNGFGTRLEEMVQKAISATIQREWHEQGLKLELRMPLDCITPANLD